MPQNRYFLREFEPTQSSLTITDEEFHHLAHVMRKKVGDSIEVTNGRGALAECTIQELGKDKAYCKVSTLTQGKKNSFPVTLALAFLRKEHLEFALEKSTELGVDTIMLFPAARSEKNELSAHAIERLEGIIISATKQSGRLFLPELFIKKSLSDAIPSSGCAFFGDLDGEPLPAIPKSPITIFIGPEGGFTREEKNKLEEKCRGIRFHENILRAETAAIAVTTLFTTQKRL
jgi:16S rRNA (uracil1498-N3)-methyltransferase